MRCILLDNISDLRSVVGSSPVAIFLNYPKNHYARVVAPPCRPRGIINQIALTLKWSLELLSVEDPDNVWPRVAGEDGLEARLHPLLNANLADLLDELGRRLLLCRRTDTMECSCKPILRLRNPFTPIGCAII